MTLDLAADRRLSKDEWQWQQKKDDNVKKDFRNKSLVHVDFLWEEKKCEKNVFGHC